MRRRQCQRYTRRIEITFSSGKLSFRGISSDLSAGGLFIRTRHGFVPGTVVDLDIYLPNGKISHLKGVVRRSVKTTIPGVKNGMGIELIERDSNYLEFLRTVVTQGEGKLKDISQPTISEEESEVRLEGERRDDSKEVRDEPAESDEFILVTCDSCKVKNKVPSNKRFGLKCGKCGTPLKIGEVD